MFELWQGAIYRAKLLRPEGTSSDAELAVGWLTGNDVEHGRSVGHAGWIITYQSFRERETANIVHAVNSIDEVTGLHKSADICRLTLTAQLLSFLQRYEFATAFCQVVLELKVKSIDMCVEVPFHACKVTKNF